MSGFTIQAHFKTLHVHDRESTHLSITNGRSTNRRFYLINGRNECALSISTCEQPYFGVRIQADSAHFDADSLRDLGQCYAHLLEQIVEQPDQPIQSIQWLNESQQRRLLNDFNSKNKLPSAEGSIIAAFRKQCAQSPHQLAVHAEQGSLTYQQLLQSAETIADELNSNSSTSPVAILTDDKAAIIVAIFAILSAGRPFVTLDPRYPEERLTHMIQDSQADTLIPQSKYNSLAHSISSNTQTIERIVYLGTHLSHSIDLSERAS